MAEFESSPVEQGSGDDVVGVFDDYDEFDEFEATPTSTKHFFWSPSGEKFWVTTDKFNKIPGIDYETGPVFRKTASGIAGYDKLHKNFESENALHEFVPEYIPQPIYFAVYKTRPDLHSYVSKFVDMVDEVPSPAAWAKAAATLHRKTMAKSPTGEFGFGITTYSANIPVDSIWNSSWEAVWTFQIKWLLDQDKAFHDPDEEYTKLQASFIDVVVPAYLRPLESNGRSISPCLLHTNLWRGHIKPKADSDSVWMMNSVPCWGHHEAELGVCRNPRYGLGEAYIEEYLKLMPKSEPTEDFDTRNAIYAMRHHVLLSLIYHEDPFFRQVAINEMKRLVEEATSAASK